MTGLKVGELCYGNDMFYRAVLYSGLKVGCDERRKNGPCYIKRAGHSEWELFCTPPRHQVPLRSVNLHKPKKITDEQLTMELRNRGANLKSYEEIAEKYRMSRWTVHNLTNKLGYGENKGVPKDDRD